jgi:hypothetical protein
MEKIFKACNKETGKYTDEDNFWIRLCNNGNKEYYSKIYYDSNFNRRDKKIIEEIEKLIKE